MVLETAVSVLAYALVALCILATAHLLSKLLAYVRRREAEDKVAAKDGIEGGEKGHKVGPVEAVPEQYRYPPTLSPALKSEDTDSTKTASDDGTFRRIPPPSPASRKVPQKSMMDVIKEQMELEMRSSESESKWKGWQEVRRDMETRRSTREMHQRNLLSVMSLSHIDPDGRYVELANTSGLRPKTENVGGWRLLRRVNSDSDDYLPEDEMEFTFPRHALVRPNQTLKVYAKDFADKCESGQLVARHIPNWGFGDFQETFLINTKNEVQSSIYWTTEYYKVNE